MQRAATRRIFMERRCGGLRCRPKRERSRFRASERHLRLDISAPREPPRAREGPPASRRHGPSSKVGPHYVSRPSHPLFSSHRRVLLGAGGKADGRRTCHWRRHKRVRCFARLRRAHRRSERSDGALVMQLPRQPGSRENRWTHLLSGAAAVPHPQRPVYRLSLHPSASLNPGPPPPNFRPKVPARLECAVTGVSRAHRPVQNIDLIKDLGRSSRCDLAAEVGTLGLVG
jgi:hypothetical protein